MSSPKLWQRAPVQVHAHKAWSATALWLKLPGLEPRNWEATSSPTDAWQAMIDATSAEHVKAARSAFALVCWMLWNKRNMRVFHDKQTQISIKDKARAWAFAGAKERKKLMFEPP